MIPFFSGSLFRQLFRGAVAAGLAASLLLGTVLVVSPTARAQAQDLIVRFVEVDSPWALLSAPSGDAESPRAGVPTPSDATSPRGALSTSGQVPPISADIGAAGLPTPSDIPAPPQPEDRASPRELTLVSLEEAQAQTSFTIKMPTSLPEGYSFKGVAKPPSLPKIEDSSLPRDGAAPPLPPAVTLVFENAAREILVLSEAKLPADFGEVPLPAGKGSVQEVTVNGQPGQYVEGGWSPQGGWDSNAKHHLLHWQGADGVTYDLLSGTLGLSELLAMAESIP